MDQLVLIGALVLLLRVGSATYLAGLTRAKNSAGIVMRLLCDLCLAVLAFWAIGAAVFAQDVSTVFGVKSSLLFAGNSADGAKSAGTVFFLATVVAIGTGVVPGALGERSKFFPALAGSLLLAGFVIPVGGSWAWHGWLFQRGFLDEAGAVWIHVAGGMCAAAGAWLLGPRDGKYHRDGSASVIPGHSIPLASLGSVIMLVGWVPYVAGCVALGPHLNASGSLAGLNVLLAAAGGTITSLMYGQWRYGKPDCLLALLGVTGAMVSVSAGAGMMASPWAVLTGAIAGVLVPFSVVWLDKIRRIDDPAGSVSIHAVGGAWGAIAAGLFAPGAAAERFKHLGIQVVGLLVIALLAGVLSFCLFALLKITIGLRVKEADEFDGLDLAEHDIGAYPDFQQNTIKSYHLREI